MYQETCDAIHEIDADMICSIGPAKYYNLCNLNETMILNNTDKVIYNFNFFIPKPYVKVGMVNYTIDWPGKIKCCDLTTKCAPGHCEQNNCDHYIDVNKECWGLTSNSSIKCRVICGPQRFDTGDYWMTHCFVAAGVFFIIFLF